MQHAADFTVVPGITAQMLHTTRLRTRVLTTEKAQENATAVIFVHGNLSSATFWEETMLALPPSHYAIAYDQRGYGAADSSAKIDATKGLKDLADDLAALMEKMQLNQATLVGHSLGGSVLWQFLRDYPQKITKLVLVAPGSPYGYGASYGLEGHWVNAECAGSGAGVVNPDFVRLMRAQDRSDTLPTSPRNIMNQFYWKPPFRPVREEALLEAMLSVHQGPQDWPGDSVVSPYFPGVAPGQFGPNNALSPKYAFNPEELSRLSHKPDIVWIRGEDDQIVSDQSFFDVGYLGTIGMIPGWSEVHPAQPMVRQTRHVLDLYTKHGGEYEEIVLDNCGHTPFIEQAERFNGYLTRILTG